MTAPEPPVPRPIRRGEWAEVRCSNIRCRWHIVTIRFVSGDAVIEIEKRTCPNCGQASVQTMHSREAA